MRRLLYRNKNDIIFILILLLLFSNIPDNSIKQHIERQPSNGNTLIVNDHINPPFLPGIAEIEKLVLIIHLQSLPLKNTLRSNIIFFLRQNYYLISSLEIFPSVVKYHLLENATLANLTIIEYIHNQEDNT